MSIISSYPHFKNKILLLGIFVNIIFNCWQPCLVPPKGSLRVGQAGDVAGGVKHLERIRKIPDHHYSLKRYELADRILERILLHKPGDVEVDKDGARDKILSIFDEARNLVRKTKEGRDG